MVASTRRLLCVSDSAFVLPKPEQILRIIGLDIGTTGTLRYEDVDGHRDTISVEAGTTMDLKVRRIFSTGTTAGMQVYAMLGEGF